MAIEQNLERDAKLLSYTMTRESQNGEVERYPEPIRTIAEDIKRRKRPITKSEKSTIIISWLSNSKIFPDQVYARKLIGRMNEIGDVTNIDDLLETKTIIPVTAADLDIRLGPVTFLWKSWLANGFVSIMASSSGEGKTTLAVDIVRRYIAKLPWPDGSPAVDRDMVVLWAEAEANQRSFKDKLDKWGMDKNKIYFPLEDSLGDFDLRDNGHCARLVEIASLPEVGLVVIDSLSGADSRAEKGVEESATIAWLARLARDLNKPILVTHHLRKKSVFEGDTITLDRLRGSSAIVQMARIVWAIDTPDPQSKQWKRLQVIKSNLSKFPDPIGFEINENTGVSYGLAPSAPEPERVIDQASDLLMDLLQRQPRAAKEVIEEFNQAGISQATMKRAKDKLKVVSRKDKDGWMWSLPAKTQYEL